MAWTPFTRRHHASMGYASDLTGPGRDDGCPSPPGQIRTCGTTAYGSYRMF